MTDTNPWEGMGKGVQRRAANVEHKKIYWISDRNGRWGISFRGFADRPDAPALPKIHGIELGRVEMGSGERALNLLLIDKDEWELFLALCYNLIAGAVGFKNDEASIAAVEHRLRRWQELLKGERVKELSLARQMGLFTELKCLQDIIGPHIGFPAAVTSWVGAEFDRQDFILDNAAVEVKSHISSKGEIVQISSKYQLDSIKEKVVLIVYALSLSEGGETVLDVVEGLRVQLHEDVDAVEMFENKLLECSFVPDLLEKPLQRFHIDNRKFYLVSDGFPRIKSKDVSPFIQDVRYAIELTYCAEFEIDEYSIFHNKGDLE